MSVPALIAAIRTCDRQDAVDIATALTEAIEEHEDAEVGSALLAIAMLLAAIARQCRREAPIIPTVAAMAQRMLRDGETMQ